MKKRKTQNQNEQNFDNLHFNLLWILFSWLDEKITTFVESILNLYKAIVQNSDISIQKTSRTSLLLFI